MAGSLLLSAQNFVASLDYGQFYLNTYLDPEDDPDDEVPDIGELVDMAIDAGGIAQAPGTLVILSPHQANSEMPLRVEIWDAPPPDDAAEWPEAFEAHLDVDHHGLSYDSPTMGSFSLGVPPGAYHALIAGQGFIAHGWTGSATPGDRWRIRLWPSSGPEVPRRLRVWRAPGH